MLASREHFVGSLENQTKNQEADVEKIMKKESCKNKRLERNVKETVGKIDCAAQCEEMWPWILDVGDYTHVVARRFDSIALDVAVQERVLDLLDHDH